jgi:hypothetical protein
MRATVILINVNHAMHYYLYYWHVIVKAIPLQAWTNPEGSRRARLPDFMTVGT